MKRKGIISLFLCVALIITSVMPTLAAVSKLDKPQYIESVTFDDLTFVAETEDADAYFKDSADAKIFGTKTEKHADLAVLDGADGTNKYAKLVITPGLEEDSNRKSNTNYKVTVPLTSIKNLVYSYDINFSEIAVNNEENAQDTEIYTNNFRGETVDGTVKWMSGATQGISFFAKPDGTPYIKSKNVTEELETGKWYTVKYAFSASDDKKYDVYITERDNAEAEEILLSNDAVATIGFVAQIESAGHKTASTIYVDNFIFAHNDMCVIKAPMSLLDVQGNLQFTAFVPEGIGSAQVKLGGVLVDTITRDEGDNGYYKVDASLAGVASQLYLGENTLTLESGDKVYTYDKPIVLQKNVVNVLNSNTFNSDTAIENMVATTHFRNEIGTLSYYSKTGAGDITSVKEGPQRIDSTKSNAFYFYNEGERTTNKPYLQMNPGDVIDRGIMSVEFDAYVAGNKTIMSLEARTVADSKIINPNTGVEFSNGKYLYFAKNSASTFNVLSINSGTSFGSKTPSGRWINIRTDFDIENKVVNYYEDGEFMGSLSYEYYTHYNKNDANFLVDTTVQGLDYVRLNFGSESGGAPEVYLDNIKLTVYTPYAEIDEVSFTNYSGNVVKSEGTVETTAQNIIVAMTGEVANVSKDTVILREKGGAAVLADAELKDGKICVTPENYLTNGVTYEIELTENIKLGENAYGIKQKTEFEAVAETGILSPADGEKIANTDTFEMIAIAPDADKVEFYIDNSPVGEAVPNEYDIATIDVESENLTLGKKAVKIIAYSGSEYETAYSSFYITNEVIYSPGGVVGYEADEDITKMSVSAQKGTVSKALSKEVKRSGESSLEVKSTPPTTTSEANRKMLFLQASYESYNMKTGTVVLDYWMWINEKDKLTLEVDTFADVTKIPAGHTIYSDAACTTVLKDGATGTRQNIVAGGSILNGGEYGKTGQSYSGNSWRHVVVKFNLDTGLLQGYCDDILCYERDTINSGKAYYLRDADGNIVCEEGTQTAKAFNTKDLPIGRMYFIRMNYYDYHSTVETSTEQSTVLYLDDWYAYNELPIPQVDGVNYKVGAETVAANMEKAIIDKDATEIELSLTSKLETSTVTANTVKMYVNSVAAAYDSVAYADGKIKITKADGFKENDKIEIVLEDAIKFLGNKATIGQDVSTLLYVAKNGLFIDTDIEVKSGKIYAWFDAMNASDEEKSVFVIFASYDGDKMLSCDVTTVNITDKKSTVLDVDATGAKTAKIMVTSSGTNIEPLINAEMVTISE